MTEFRILGALDLRGADGQPITSVLTQPKRTALLAYLALAEPRGFHRRDTLTGVFWPELDQERARASLRKAVFQLRQSLGAGTILSRGDEEIALADDVWCDAVAMTHAFEHKDFARAFELYRGPLLNGFFTNDARVFEDWLERERARLSQMAFAAASAMADAEEKRGDYFAAAYWARQSLSVLPADETTLRKLLTLLERIDDRGGALAAYEEFARRLREDFDAEPSETTRAIVERIRRRSELPVPPALPAAPPEQPQQREQSNPATPRSTRRIAIAVAIALMIFGGAEVVRRTTSPAAASLTNVGVLPFSFEGDPELSYLANGLASLLATNLDGADVTETTGLQRYVKGKVIHAGDALRVTAALYDNRGHVLARGSVQGAVDDLFTVVDALAAQLITDEAGNRHGTLELAARTTRSLPALKSYLHGESQFRAGHYTDAVASYQRAIQEDSTFALAYYRLAASYGWTADSLALPTARLAVQRASRLSLPDRELLEALVPFYEGRADEAERRYRAILQRFPFESEAWFPLGDLLFHYNGVRGRSIAEARQPFEHALKHGPADGPLTHLIEIAAIQGDYVAFDTLFQRIEPGAHFHLVGRTVRAFTNGTESEQRALLKELDGIPMRDLAILARHVPFLIAERDDAVRLLRYVGEPARPYEVRALAHILLAYTEVGSGRLRAAEAELDKAASFDRTRALEHRAYLSSLWFVPRNAQREASLRAQLAHIDSATARSWIFGADHELRPAFQAYLRGMIEARTGNIEAVEEIAAGLAQRPAPEAADELPANLAHGIRALAQMQRNEVQAALDHLERITVKRGAADLMGAIPFFSMPHERFLHGEALRSLGRFEEALGWYESFVEHSPFSRAYRAPAQLKQAAIYERLGQREKALTLYRSFAAAWRECDPELKPLLVQANNRIAALQ